MKKGGRGERDWGQGEEGGEGGRREGMGWKKEAAENRKRKRELLPPVSSTYHIPAVVQRQNTRATVKVSRDSVDQLVFLPCVTVLPGDVPLKSRHQQVGEEVESQEH